MLPQTVLQLCALAHGRQRLAPAPALQPARCLLLLRLPRQWALGRRPRPGLLQVCWHWQPLPPLPPAVLQAAVQMLLHRSPPRLRLAWRMRAVAQVLLLHWALAHPERAASWRPAPPLLPLLQGAWWLAWR